MATYEEIIPGLIIELPEEPGHNGVILDTTRLNKEWYKVTVLCHDGDVLILKLKLQENGEYFDWKDSTRYDGVGLLRKLSVCTESVILQDAW